MPRAQLAKTAPAEIAVSNFSQWMTASGPLRHLPGKSRAFCPAPIYTPGLIPRKMPQAFFAKTKKSPGFDAWALESGLSMKGRKSARG
jgi:hypothetical protein